MGADWRAINAGFDQQHAARAVPCSRLQAAAVAFGESCSLPIPEIVAIGGQSDGKSSLLEAFLGVRRSCSRHSTPACLRAPPPQPG
jgi:hypothetical protein